MDVSIIVPTKGLNINLSRNYSSWKELGNVYIVDSAPGDDNLRSFCSKHNMQYAIFDWTGFYPKKRQWALDNLNLKYDWVLFIDDDEFVPNNFISLLNRLDPPDDCACYQVKYTNYFITMLIDCFNHLGDVMVFF